MNNKKFKNSNIDFGEAVKNFKQFDIPYYQRTYVWHINKEGNTLKKFIKDIIENYIKEPNEKYFIGNLTFNKNDKYANAEIVDGQQRITSLILMLIQLTKDSKIDEETKNKIEDFLKIDKETNILNEKFLIQEKELTREILMNVYEKKNTDNKNSLIEIKKALKIIKEQIDNKKLSLEEMKGIATYVMENINFNYILYQDTEMALKYFLNINSLSVELSSEEIFYTIISQALKMTEVRNEYEIKEIKKKINELKVGYGFKKEEVILNIFLKSYYWNDPFIKELKGEIGSGQWMNYHKNDSFSNKENSYVLITNFEKFIKDLECIKNALENENTYDHINTTSSILKKNKIIDLFLISLLGKRNNFIKGNNNVTKQNFYNFDKFSKQFIEDCKLFNSIYFKDVILENNINETLEEYRKQLEKEERNYQEIYENTNFRNILSFGYLPKSVEDDNKSNKKQQSNIKEVLTLQEAFLISVANEKINMNEAYTKLMKRFHFQIEHLISIKEFQENERRKEWEFKDAKEFDAERQKFINLTLLEASENNDAGTKSFREKRRIYYENAKTFDNLPNYLVSSLIENSPFYNNEKIMKLGLPKRVISSDQKFKWELDEDVNEKFNTELLKLSFKKMFE